MASYPIALVRDTASVLWIDAYLPRQITGGSRGIGDYSHPSPSMHRLTSYTLTGAATAERLADDGYSVVITYSSNSKGATDVVSKIEGKHGKGSAFVSNTSVQELVVVLTRSGDA